MDSTPVVAITGQVSRAMIGRDAFQETDIIGITQPITKHSRLVEDVEELAEAVHEAFAVAQRGAARAGAAGRAEGRAEPEGSSATGRPDGRAPGAAGRREGLDARPTPTALLEAARLIAGPSGR